MCNMQASTQHALAQNPAIACPSFFPCKSRLIPATPSICRSAAAASAPITCQAWAPLSDYPLTFIKYRLTFMKHRQRDFSCIQHIRLFYTYLKNLILHIQQQVGACACTSTHIETAGGLRPPD